MKRTSSNPLSPVPISHQARTIPGGPPSSKINEAESPAVGDKEKARACIPATIPLELVSNPFLAPVRPISPPPRTSLLPEIRRDTVDDLANHVSLQIFSSPASRANKNAVMFLHGGPSLEYDADFAHVTSWFVNHGYTVIAPEIAGSGPTGLKNTSNSHTRNYVRDLESVIQWLSDESDFKSKEFCVVAHSWGGFQLASLLTDGAEKARQFFKQVVFISANLDSAQTRLFADPVCEYSMISNFSVRHAGSAEVIGDEGKMTVTNNPLMDQSLNENFSPFYRLDKVPIDIPYLFFHAIDDVQVPVSQSIDSFNAIKRAGGDAKIVIAEHGCHGFFKAGAEHNPEVMTTCFDAIDTLVKTPEKLTTAMIGSQSVDSSDVTNVEKGIAKIDGNYKNYKKVLDAFHSDDRSVPGEIREDRDLGRTGRLRKFRADHQNVIDRLSGRVEPVVLKTVADKKRIVELIDKALETS
ncbi:MAG: Peptidase prolyl oligopeptidase domain protein [Herminiimonas sp.]|nr:Peptidase prolyl oligopeptidase domain protein [Herminiimonas sp.]